MSISIAYFPTSTNIDYVSIFRAKYPLAVVEALLDAFGDRIGCGYNIGCQFGNTLCLSEIGKRATEQGFRCLVGLFYGHAHNCLCQLMFLATYVLGLGLEDLEGCERFFSKSNTLATTLRYMSVFHRRQDIARYIQHHNTFEVSQNLSVSPAMENTVLVSMTYDNI